MDKWVVYILLAVCLSSCGRGNGNKQVGFSNSTIADSVPTEAIRLKRQGNDLFNNGDLEDAHKYYIKAIELAPEYDTAFYDLGKVYSRLGDDKRAIENYTKALKVNPYYIFAYYNRGNNKANIGDNNGAISDYSEAIRLNPLFAEAYFNLSLIHI